MNEIKYENNQEYMDLINENVNIIKAKANKEYEYVIVLGSGLNDLIKNVNVDFEMSFEELTGMPKATVKGHEGKLIFGVLNNKNVIIQQGRIHCYEGHNLRKVTTLIRVYGKLGIKNIILTNAAGGINSSYAPGDIMLIKDHINFFGINPLIGQNLDEFGERFPNMSNLYDKETINNVISVLEKKEKRFHVGNYVFMSGPSYETAAEINALKLLGADAVGMSTVPEAIVARHAGIKVFAMSCITNACTSDAQPTHEEVIENANRAKNAMIESIDEVLEVM